MKNSASKGGNTVCQENHYILLIKETLALNWSDEFEGLSVSYTPSGETQISGLILDQSALHGLLARIRDLNLTLISVNRLLTENLQDTEPKNIQ